MDFAQLYSYCVQLIEILRNFATKFFDVMFTPMADLPSFEPPYDQMFADFLSQYGLSDVSLLGFALGAGVTIYIVISIVKFVLDIVL